MTAYPSICKACLEIAYANGGVNRYRPEEQVLREIGDFLSTRPYSDHFTKIDTWLGSLGRDDLETICDGEQTEADTLLTNSPPFTQSLLYEYFDEVC